MRDMQTHTHGSEQGCVASAAYLVFQGIRIGDDPALERQLRT
jgi:hypothetical protein